MTKELILKDLYEIRKNYVSCLELDKLIEKVKHDVTCESLPETTTKARYNTILKFLNSKVNQNKPILQLTHLYNNYQVFTDSYMLFRFYDNDIIEQLPQTHDIKYKNYPSYPQTYNLIDPIIKDAQSTAKFYIEDLKKSIKTNEDNYIFLELDNISSVKLDIKKLDNFIKILGYKNKDIITFKYIQSDKPDYIKPLYAQQSATREGVILPVSWTKDELEG